MLINCTPQNKWPCILFHIFMFLFNATILYSFFPPPRALYKKQHIHVPQEKWPRCVLLFQYHGQRCLLCECIQVGGEIKSWETQSSSSFKWTTSLNVEASRFKQQQNYCGGCQATQDWADQERVASKLAEIVLAQSRRRFQLCLRMHLHLTILHNLLIWTH